MMGFDHAGGDFRKRRFARSIRAEKRNDLAATKDKVDVLKRPSRTEALGQWRGATGLDCRQLLTRLLASLRRPVVCRWAIRNTLRAWTIPRASSLLYQMDLVVTRP